MRPPPARRPDSLCADVKHQPSPFLRSLSLFAEEKHQPFQLGTDGEARGAALLVHGFPGTPADMRPLAASLNADGWAIDAPLLPGFGPGIITLPRRTHAEWRDAVVSRARALRSEYRSVIVVGHSLGAAVGVLSGVRELADGYALLAPYWRFGGAMTHLFWPLLRPFFGRWRPLSRVDFSDERVRNGLLRVIPDLDLDDPAVQEELRAFTVPTQLLDELRRLGIAAGRAAARLASPALVVQGLRDGLVRPEHSARLVRRLPQVRGHETVNGSHNLPDPADGAWERVEAAVLRFAAGIA